VKGDSCNLEAVRTGDIKKRKEEDQGRGAFVIPGTASRVEKKERLGGSHAENEI